MKNPITKPIHYTEEDVKDLYEIFKDEEKRLKEKNPFVYLFEKEGFRHEVLEGFLNFLRKYDVNSGATANYKDICFIEGIAETTVAFTEDLYQLLFICDRKNLPTYLNNNIFGKFAHWRILTKQ